MSSTLSHHAAQQLLQNRWPWDPQGTCLPELFRSDVFLDHLFVKGSDAYSCRKRLLDFAGISGDPAKSANLREALERLFQQPEARARFHWGSTFGDGERGFLALLRDSFTRSWNRYNLIGVNLSHPPEARVKTKEAAKEPKASKEEKPKVVAPPPPKSYGPRDLAELGHAHLILLLECPLADTHWTLCKSLAEHPEVQSLLYPDTALLDACRRDFDSTHLTCRDVLLTLGHGQGRRKSFLELRQKELGELRQLLLDSDSLLEKRKAALVAVVQRLAQDLDAMQAEIDRIKANSVPHDWLSQARQLLPGLEIGPEARALLPHIDKALTALAEELAAIERSREKALELAPLNTLTAQLKSSLSEELLTDLKEYLDLSLGGGAQPQLYLLPDSDIYKRFEWLQKLLKNRELEELAPPSAGDFTHALASAIRSASSLTR